MPELPEVETTRRGIAPFLVGQQVAEVVVHNPNLRWPVPAGLGDALIGQTLITVGRRGKYLLLEFSRGTLIVHLGMSGHLRVLTAPQAMAKHDHVDIAFAGGCHLRLHDPRRFGSISWTSQAPQQHPLLMHLGVEPLDGPFCGDYLYHQARGRKTSVKSLIMDARVVTGVGNIYANESLYRAGIRPMRQASRISLRRYQRLASAIREILQDAIGLGGTTLRDFVNSDGRPGYFEANLTVYGREGLPCRECGTAIRKIRQGQRSTYYCPACQQY